jgi:hypothetical protein
MTWTLIGLAALVFVIIFPATIMFLYDLLHRNWERISSCFWPFAGMASGISLGAIGIELILNSLWGLSTILHGVLVVALGSGAMWFCWQKLRKKCAVKPVRALQNRARDVTD